MKANERHSSRPALRRVAIAIGVYIAWVAATYFLEGRINLFQRVDPVGRITYVAVANIVIGTLISGLTIRYLLRSRFIEPNQIGLVKSPFKIAAMIGVSVAGGLALFMLQIPRPFEPIVVFNAFMHVLPVSIAEVMVCWAMVGTSFESLSRAKGKVVSVVIGTMAATILFGLYHYAHSPPFNQTNMVLFLMLPGFATALTYFLSRDIYSTVIVQNFLGIVGVLASLPNLEPYRQPILPLYALSAVSVAALVITVSGILRRADRKIKGSKKRAKKSPDDSLDEKNTAI